MPMKKLQHIRSQLFETPRELTKDTVYERYRRAKYRSRDSETNRFLHESLLKIWDFFHECEKFVFSRVERSGTSGKTLNFSHEWKKSQIFNKYECKYLFLPFQLKNKACRFHSFIRMSMSCLLHKILQRYVQCSKYTLI
jgi:hypothetical protein